MAINEVPSNKTFTDKIDYADITIGNDKVSTEFQANVKMRIWNEDDISLEMENVKGIPTLADDKISLGLADKTLQWYKDGDALKWITVLNKKPATNKITYKLGGNWQDFDFRRIPHFPSPEIRIINGEEYEYQSYIAKYDMHNCQQPLKYANGYMVRHKHKRNHIVGVTPNYKNGNAFAIQRPKATDADGNYVYGDIEVINGNLTETIPTAFLDSAKYPVICNATFGFTTGVSAGSFNSNQCRVTGTYTGAAGTATGISFEFAANTNADNYTYGIYLDTGANDPDGLSPVTNGVTNEISVNGTGWIEATFGTNPTVTSGEYWIGLCHQTYYSGNALYYDGSASETMYYDAFTYSAGNLSDPYTPNAPDPLDATAAYNCYVTYTPSGGGGVAPTGNIRGPLVGPLGGPI